MATSTGKTQCIKCGKEKYTMRCGGCRQEFCFKHMSDHHQEFVKQLDDIEVNHDVFRAALNEKTQESKKHPLIQQIDNWQREAIETIEKTAEEAKQLLFKHSTEYFKQLETKLNSLTNQLKEIRQEDDFNEINLRHLQEELVRLTTQLEKPPNISLQQDSSAFIKKIYIDMSGTHSARPTDVTVKCVVSTETQSTVSMGNTQKMAALLDRLGTTHQQINEYACSRTEQISEEVAAAIARVVADTQVQQQTLFDEANARSAVIKEEYKLKLHNYIEELDSVKHANLSALEKDLNLRQEMILEQARKRIDDLNEEANRLKLGVLCEVQVQDTAKVDAINQQVVALDAEDASRFLTSTVSRASCTLKKPSLSKKHRRLT